MLNDPSRTKAGRFLVTFAQVFPRLSLNILLVGLLLVGLLVRCVAYLQNTTKTANLPIPLKPHLLIRHSTPKPDSPR